MLMYSCIPLHLLGYSRMLYASGLLEADSVDVMLVALPTELPSHILIGDVCYCVLAYSCILGIIHGCFVLRGHFKRIRGLCHTLLCQLFCRAMPCLCILVI